MDRLITSCFKRTKINAYELVDLMSVEGFASDGPRSTIVICINGFVTQDSALLDVASSWRPVLEHFKNGHPYTFKWKSSTVVEVGMKMIMETLRNQHFGTGGFII
jgi:hypothetical protein